MKKMILAGCAVCLCAMMVACGGNNKDATTTTIGTSEPTTVQTGVITSESLTELFDSYSLDNGAEDAEAIMEAFVSDFPLFLETLSAYESSEQVLMLIGMKVKAAELNGDSSYQNAMDSVDAAELTGPQQQTLTEIKANIESDEVE